MKFFIESFLKKRKFNNNVYFSFEFLIETSLTTYELLSSIVANMTQRHVTTFYKIGTFPEKNPSFSEKIKENRNRGPSRKSF